MTQTIGALMGNVSFPRTEARKKFLHTVFTDAMETGVGSWARVKKYHWAKSELRQEIITNGQPITCEVDDIDNFYAVLTPIEDGWGVWDDPKENRQELRVDIDTIERGLMRYWEYVMGERDQLGYPAGHEDCNQEQLGPGRIDQDSYWMQTCVADLTNGADGDYDAMTLSAVIELALFDQVVYA